MKHIFLFLLALAPALALAQTGTVKDSVRVLTTAEIAQGNSKDSAHIYFIDTTWKKIRMDSLARFARVKLIGDRGDITVSGEGLTWSVNNGAITGAKLATGAVDLTATTVTGTLPVSKGGTNVSSFTANGILYASSTSQVATGAGLTYDGTNFATGGTATATKFIPSTGGTATGNGMYSPGNNAISFSTNGTERIRISGGNISIGGNYSQASYGFYAEATSLFYNAATQTFPFELKGGMSKSTNGNYVGFKLSSSESQGNNLEGVYSIYGAANTNDRFLYIYAIENTGGGGFSWRNVRLGGGGNVGIGSMNPTEKLHVDGNARITGLANAENPVAVEVDDNGKLIRASSYELKENIHDSPYGLQEVMALRPLVYTYKKKSYGDKRDVGFIAQDIENMIPEAVGTGPDSEIFLDRTKLIPVLVKAIQEQQAQIEELKNRIIQLENK